MEYKGNGIYQHGGRDIADAPLETAAHKIAETGPQKRENPAESRARAGDHRHPEGRAVLHDTGAGHHRPHAEIQRAARRDKKTAIHTARRAPKPGGSPLSPKRHENVLLSLHKIRSL